MPLLLLFKAYLKKKTADYVLALQNTTAYLKDDMEEDQKTTFTSLHWGKEYCVSVKLEGSGNLPTSSISKKQCLQLPEQGKEKMVDYLRRLLNMSPINHIYTGPENRDGS